MKAKDYFEKYSETITDNETLKKFSSELLDEAIGLIKARKCSSPEAVVSCFKEINNKYNSVCRMITEKYGEDVLVLNGFKVLAISHYKDSLPEFALVLEQYWK